MFGAFGLFATEPASADVLVSNIGQGRAIHLTTGNYANAQGFTTGSDPYGYTLTSIEVVVGANPSASQRATIRAELWSAATGGGPDSKLADLTVPATVSAGTVSFGAPADTMLSGRTTYYIVLYTTTVFSLSVDSTASNAEDSGGQSGWSIADVGWYINNNLPVGSWTLDTAANTPSFRMRVNGSGAWTDLRVTPGDRRLNLSWTAPDLPRLTVLTGYDVQYREAVCTKPQLFNPNAGTSLDPVWVPRIVDGARAYRHCTATEPHRWIDHGAWAGSYDPLASQTTRVIDGLWPGVAYDVRVRVRTTNSTWAYVYARGTPSGGDSNARLLQIQLIEKSLNQQ